MRGQNGSGGDSEIQRKIRYMKKIIGVQRSDDPAFLSAAAADDDPVVRREAAMNQNTPGPVLEHLSKDPDPDVRLMLMINPVISEGTLTTMMDDEDERVRQAASRWLSIRVGEENENRSPDEDR